MKNRLKFRIRALLMTVCTLVAMTACSEWTEQEGIDISHPSVEETNPELYAKYLAALNAYKESKHQVVYAWFDNSLKENIPSRSHLICDIPDSVDIVTLMSPNALTQDELKDLATIRTKGTKVIFEIDYKAIREQFETLSAEDPEADWTSYMEREVDTQLAWVEKYGYDGVTVCYVNMALNYVPDAEKEAFEAIQKAFFAKFSVWKNAHADKILCFNGSAETLIDKSILGHCRYILLNTLNATSQQELTVTAMNMLREEVPTDRFIAVVRPFSTDATDLKTGYFTAADGSSVSAILEAARWTAMPDVHFGKVGLGIYAINNDYYNSAMVYAYTRKAIALLNPSR